MAYRIVITALCRIPAHLRTLDLDEVQRCADAIGTEDEQHLVRELRGLLTRVP